MENVWQLYQFISKTGKLLLFRDCLSTERHADISVYSMIK